MITVLIIYKRYEPSGDNRFDDLLVQRGEIAEVYKLTDLNARFGDMIVDVKILKTE
jgi:hypothetical protein